MGSDVFCTKEQTDKTVFYESEHFLLLYDIRPVVRGHFLFVAKRHVQDIMELTEAETMDMHKTFRKVIPRMLRLYEASDNSYDMTSQIGEYSGRSIPHLHIHILPRKKDDFYNKTGESIFEDLSLNKTHYKYADVEAEVRMLRKEFRYAPK